jgi:hypothetical protein
MTDPLLTQLRELATAGEPSPPPAGLIEAVRADAPRLRARRRARTRTRAGIVVATGALLIAASFTPAGRAATGWVADIAGIGDTPTIEHAAAKPGSAVVFGTDETPDGTPFEIVAYRTSPRGLLREQNADAGVRVVDNSARLVCPAIDFPGYRLTGDTACSIIGSGPGPKGLSGMGFSLPQHPGQVPAQPLWGEIGPEVESVRVIIDAPDERPRDLKTTVAQLSGALQERVGADHAFGLFVAFPPLPTERNDLDRYGLKVIAYDGDGNEIDRQGLLPGPLSSYSSRSEGGARDAVRLYLSTSAR